MDEQELRSAVADLGGKHAVVGAAVGVVLGDSEHYAYHGVTSVENPLPVDSETLFQFGSTGKTFTGTAIMRLVEQGRVDLQAPVRTYVPELVLQDEEAAREVTVLELLNHTAGWDGDLIVDTGNGDDALAQYVKRMADIRQITRPGEAVSYNNASLSLAGRVIEKVTGQVYETAVQEAVLGPLGLAHSFYFPGDIMSRRFAAGHNRTADGSFAIARPWPMPRSAAPAGGMSSNARDQIAWARFHMGDGRADDGTRILAQETLAAMQRPTADCFGSALGDHCGITWWLRDVGAVRIVQHGGDTNGQHSAFLMVPERHFAVISLTNCGPNGPEFNEAIVRWALEAYLGIREEEPSPEPLAASALEAYLGRYDTIAVVTHVRMRDGGLEVVMETRPEVLAQLSEAGQEPPEPEPPVPLGFLPGPGDRYVVTGGPAKGMRGYFRRDKAGQVDAIHLGGRLALRAQD